MIVEKKKETKQVWVEREKDKAESSLIVQTALHAERRNLCVVDNGPTPTILIETRKSSLSLKIGMKAQ